MNASQKHRGPDAEGLWSSGRAALGHRRLSIIDLSPEAHQPLLNEDRTIGATVNGGMYDFAELRADLIAKGHRFRSNSDSEVVLHLHEEYGPDGIAKMTGMFAFALWDSRNQRLVLARDRAGKKPLFYRRRRRRPGLPLGADGSARLSRDLPAEPNFAAIDEYLTLQYVPTPHTAFRDIHKLPAAHLAILEPGANLVVRRYWRKPEGLERGGSEEDLARELRDLLAKAVRRRLVADVPVGVFLSGGIDSSTVVALMATQSTARFKRSRSAFPTRPTASFRGLARSPRATAPSITKRWSDPLSPRSSRSWSGITASRSPTAPPSPPIVSLK